MSTSAEYRKDASEIASLLPELIAGQRAQSDQITALVTSMERTSVIQEHMLSELKTLKDDRVAGDKRVEERLTTVEFEYHKSRQAPWSLLLSATGVAMAVAGMASSLVYFAITSKTNSLQDLIVTEFAAQKKDIVRVENLSREHAQLEGHPHSVIQKIEALDKRIETQIRSTSDRFDRREERWDQTLDDMRRTLTELTKRVYPLYKDGVQY